MVVVVVVVAVVIVLVVVAMKHSSISKLDECVRSRRKFADGISFRFRSNAR